MNPLSKQQIKNWILTKMKPDVWYPIKPENESLIEEIYQELPREYELTLHKGKLKLTKWT